jgi:hypothetical protein
MKNSTSTAPAISIALYQLGFSVFKPANKTGDKNETKKNDSHQKPILIGF